MPSRVHESSPRVQSTSPVRESSPQNTLHPLMHVFFVITNSYKKHLFDASKVIDKPLKVIN